MKRMTNDVTEYIEADVSIFFEPDHVACQYCPLLSETPRYQCRRTGEYIHDTRVTIGRWCPLIFNAEDAE